MLQGGGALGAYQAGVYEALAEAGELPDWIAGISIGAINAALIAGNAPADRLPALRAFWDEASSHLTIPAPAQDGPLRRWFNEGASAFAALAGVPGFFTPRLPGPLLAMPGTAEATSWYDTAPLRKTLAELVDFDRINRAGLRFSAGAVQVLTGNFVYFDNRERVITPDHVMASGALPPGFPAVVIDGEPYWDGGLVSNTPLQYVLDSHRHGDCTVFQVDLFSARGPLPQTLADVAQREKDIRFSSRTRLNTDIARERKRVADAARRLAARLPAQLRDDPDLAILLRHDEAGAISIMHLINRPETCESQGKDYEFSRQTITEHWQAGREDTRRSLADPRWRRRRRHRTGIVTFDLCDTDSSSESEQP
ncbi:MAG: patatin-like phospholipase family protein [Sphingomonadales bacterium]|nr:patatin-like phospholipase family protein [Sphingomonadales bacterium]